MSPEAGLFGLFALGAVGVFTAFVIAGVLLFRRAMRRERERLAALAAFVAQQGWQLSPTDPYGLLGRWRGHPFGNDSEKVVDVVTGAYGGRSFVAFDYAYETEGMRDADGHRSSTTWTYAVVAMAMPGPLPEVEVGPQNIFAKVARAFGKDLPRLGRPDFDDRFVVGAREPAALPYVLTPRAVEALLAHGSDVHLRTAGGDLLTWEPGVLDPARLHRLVHLAAEVVAGVPPDAFGT